MTGSRTLGLPFRHRHGTRRRDQPTERQPKASPTAKPQHTPETLNAAVNTNPTGSATPTCPNRRQNELNTSTSQT
jgi:hypothetical protein